MKKPNALLEAAEKDRRHSTGESWYSTLTPQQAQMVDDALMAVAERRTFATMASLAKQIVKQFALPRKPETVRRLLKERIAELRGGKAK